MRKIIFLTNSPFNKRDFNRLGVELLEKNGFDVEVWDLTDIFFPLTRKDFAPPDPINWAYHKAFNNTNYVLDKLKDLNSDTFIIVLVKYNRRSYSIYKAISESDAKYASFWANVHPSVKIAKKGNLGRFLYYLEKLKDPVNKIINYSFMKLPLSWLRLKPASLLLAGGLESLKFLTPIDRHTEVLWIHTLDYDLYLKEKSNPFSDKDIAVFLDEYLPFHPDFSRQKTAPPIEANKYYPRLNKFFMLIEQQLNLEVIIAAHPRSHHEKLSVFFEGRKWITGQTVKLIKESKLVLAHSSTSLNFVNLYYKPVIFMTSSELDNNYKGSLISKVAELFGKEPVYIDKNDDIDWNFELTVSKIHYENYRKKYVKTENSEELPFWQIVANRLKKGF